jgi:hypothetical protein
MVKALQQHIPSSNLVETNTLYKGKRYTTADHRETIKVNGWDFCPVDIMDEDGAVMIPVRGGKHFSEMSVGKHMLTYDSMVVLTHFKGHAMGGFGGSLKNIAIGCADGAIGKKMVHAAPDNEDYSHWLNGEPFMENMVESAKATIDHFSRRIVFINVLRNMSVDCDCAGVSAAPVKARDPGLYRYPGRGPGLDRHGVQVARSGAPRPQGTHRIPQGPAPALVHERDEDGQRSV